jgi:hypothetical protein
LFHSSSSFQKNTLIFADIDTGLCSYAFGPQGGTLKEVL